MTNGEYRQLIEFLGQKFGDVDRRFADVDRQFVEVRTQLADLRGGFTMVQEGLAETREELMAFRQATRREFEDVRALIRLSYGDLDSRVRRLEGER